VDGLVSEGLPTEIAVCVASCRRPEGLFALLGALDAQIFAAPEPSLRIVVVDNDPAGSAAPVCEEARRWLRHPLRYLHEKRRGIPMARNAAVAAAWDLPWIVFVDDDERPEPGWLDALRRAQRERDADLVAGPVLPDFECEPPEWLQQGRFLEYEPSGAHSARTGNLLVRTRCLAAQPVLFDERMVPIGEDRELFERVAAAGARIVWAPDAVVRETVPRERMTLRYVLARGQRVGVASTRIARLRSSRLRAAPRALAHGGWCMLRGLVEASLAPLRGASAGAAGLRLLAFGLGRWRGLAGRAQTGVSLPDQASGGTSA
jgi:hypothetical protein